MTATGDCFKAAIDVAVEMAPADALVCHGTVTGCDRDGNVVVPAHSHAWVERGDLCIDRSNGRDAELPREVYYRLGGVENVTRYPRRVALRKLIAAGHYGPWPDG